MGMFHARDFVVRDGDTVYVTEAPFVQWSKTINAITGTTTAADSLSSIGSGTSN
jgi:polysaccharide export outer membrane protein